MASPSPNGDTSLVTPTPSFTGDDVLCLFECPHTYTFSFYAINHALLLVGIWVVCKILRSVLDSAFEELPAYKRLSDPLRNNVVFYLVLIAGTTVSLALSLLGLSAFWEDDLRDFWDLIRFYYKPNALLITDLYLYELAYRQNMRPQLILHHLCTIGIIAFLFAATERTLDYDIGRIGASLLFHANTEEHVFLGLLMYRLNMQGAPFMLRLSSVSSFLFKMIATCSALYFFVQSTSGSSPEHTATYVVVPVTIICLFWTQYYGARVTYLLSYPKKERRDMTLIPLKKRKRAPRAATTKELLSAGSDPSQSHEVPEPSPPSDSDSDSEILSESDIEPWAAGLNEFETIPRLITTTTATTTRQGEEVEMHEITSRSIEGGTERGEEEEEEEEEEPTTAPVAVVNVRTLPEVSTSQDHLFPIQPPPLPIRGAHPSGSVGFGQWLWSEYVAARGGAAAVPTPRPAPTAAPVQSHVPPKGPDRGATKVQTVEPRKMGTWEGIRRRLSAKSTHETNTQAITYQRLVEVASQIQTELEAIQLPKQQAARRGDLSRVVHLFKLDELVQHLSEQFSEFNMEDALVWLVYSLLHDRGRWQKTAMLYEEKIVREREVRREDQRAVLESFW